MIESETSLGLEYNDSIRVVWFGNPENLIGLKYFSSVFEDNHCFRLVLCGVTLNDAANLFSGCNLEVHPWSRSTFLDILRSCDVSILSHYGSICNRQKSGHKMITSICHGVPAIVSATPDHKRIAEYAGVRAFLYSDKEQLLSRLQCLKSPLARTNYIQTAKPRLMLKYYPGSYAFNVARLLSRLDCYKRSKPRLYKLLINRADFFARTIEFIGRTYWRKMQR